MSYTTNCTTATGKASARPMHGWPCPTICIGCLPCARMIFRPAFVASNRVARGPSTRFDGFRDLSGKAASTTIVCAMTRTCGYRRGTSSPTRYGLGWSPTSGNTRTGDANGFPAMRDSMTYRAFPGIASHPQPLYIVGAGLARHGASPGGLHAGQAPHLHKPPHRAARRCRACPAWGFTGKAPCGASPASTGFRPCGPGLGMAGTS